MAYLAKGRKEDLFQLAIELELKDLEIEERRRKEDLEIEERRRKEDLEERKRKEDLGERKRKEDLENEERRRKEDLEDRRRKEELEFELKKLKIESEKKDCDLSVENGGNPAKDFKNLIHTYNLKEDISLYLTLFERQARRVKIPEESWITYLLGLLPYDITEMIAREPEEEVQTYESVKELLMKRFKLTSEKFRQLFTKHQKNPEKTWLDFYHELCNYFGGWIDGLKVTTFDQLRDLIIADQIKKRAPIEFKEFYVDEWPNLICPKQFAQKLEVFEDVKQTVKPKFPNVNHKFKFGPGEFIYVEISIEKKRVNIMNLKLMNYSDFVILC